MRESCSLTLNSHEDDRPGATRPRYSLGAFPPLIVDRWVQCFQPTTTPTAAPNPSLQPRLRNHTPTLPTIPQNGTGQHRQKLRGYQRHHKQEKQNPPPPSSAHSNKRNQEVGLGSHGLYLIKNRGSFPLKGWIPIKMFLMD